MFKVDNGVPLPEKVTAAKKYPFGALKVGQSFFVPGAGFEDISNYYAREKKAGRQIAARIWEQGGIEGIRVWRVK